MKRIHLNQVDSTNLYLERNARGLPEVCAVRADFQSAGMGRLSRKWESGRGGLWFSLLFKQPFLEPHQMQRLCSLSVLSVLERAVDEEGFGLKWPNDIYYKTRKISGCLQKNLFQSNRISCIIGTGININNQISPELINKAITLKQIGGRIFDIKDIFNKIICEIEERLTDSSVGRMREEYRLKALIKPGSLVQVCEILNDKLFQGKVLNYPEQSIQLMTNEGQIKEFKAADVTFKAW